MSDGRREGGAPGGTSGEELVSLLYGELPAEEAERTGAQVAADPELTARLGEMRRVRELFSAMADEEPPARLTAQLMAEAARAAPQARRSSAAGEGGFWARLVSWLQPVTQRPALAAAASLVLVAGVAGVLYLKQGEELTSTAPPPPPPPAEPVDRGAGQAAAAAETAPPPVATAGEGADTTRSADGDEEAGEPAPAGPARTVRKPTPRSKRAVEPAEKARASSPPQKKAELKGGTVLGLSEQELAPADDQAASAPAAGGAYQGKQDTRAAPRPSAEPAPAPQAPTSDSKAPAPPSVRTLHQRAVDAAMDRRCTEVRQLAGQVRAADRVYYDRSFAGDKRLQSCLSASPATAPAKK